MQSLNFLLSRHRSAVATAVVVLSVAVTIVLWLVLRRSERAHVSRLTNLEARAIRADLLADLNSRFNAMTQLAKLADIGEAKGPQWNSLGTLFMDHYPGCVAVEFADPEFNVRKVVTLDSKQTDVNNDVSKNPVLLAALKRAASDARPWLTPLERDSDGTLLEFSVVPIFKEHTFKGFLIAKMQMKAAAQNMLADMTDLGYSMALLEGDTPVFVSPGADMSLASRWHQDEVLDFGGVRFTIRAWPTAGLLPQLRSRIPEAILLFGLQLTVLLLVAIYLEGEARRQSEFAKTVNEGLQREIGVRHKAEQRARESQARFAAVLETSSDAIISSNSLQRITLFNRAAEVLFGYKAEEVLGKHIDLLLPGCYEELHHQQVQFFADSGEMKRNLTPEPSSVTGIKKDGTKFPLEAAISSIEFKGETLYTAILRDVTERRRAEEALRRAREELEARVFLRTTEVRNANAALQEEIGQRKRMEESLSQLSGRLLQLQDDERRRIARELHDSAAQYLAALALNLSMIQREGGDSLSGTVKRLLDESTATLDKCASEIRTMSYLLHPPLLDELGLHSALQWYVKGFVKRSGVDTGLHISPELGRLPVDVERTIFRIVQECLTNVRRHSGARNAEIRICRQDDCVRLTVRDDGRGIPDGLILSGDIAAMGVGVAGMRERVRQLGGQFEIIGGSPGTCIEAVLPSTRADSPSAAA